MFSIDENTVSLTLKVCGKDQTFFVLTPYDRFEIVAQLKKARRDALIANLDGGEIKGAERFVELENFENTWKDDVAFIDFVNSAKGDIETPARALRMDNQEEAKRIVS